ncbi:MAG: HlyC/CorC family transporter, partial [Clostridiales bacterium]|nr:HlyC/CorC family transporter [Clostridiales bacterium]
MDDNGPAGMILFFVLLLISMLFHGFSAAISNLNDEEIEKYSLSENRKKRRALRLIAIKNVPMRYTITSQVASSLVYIILGGFYLELWITNITVFFTGNPTVDSALKNLLFVTALLLLISIFLIFGVLVPKKVGTKYARQISYGFITPMYLITWIFLPLTWLISIASKSVLMIFGIKNNEEYADVTEEEIISMVNEGHEQGVLEASEAEMITNIFEFGDKEATDIMTHRKNIVAVENTMLLKDAIDFMLEEKYSRYPVYHDTIDQIIGILYLKDSLRIYSDSNYLNTPIKDIEGLIREAQFIPETKNIDDLFKNMQSLKIQMTIIIDEYGQTSGLVTMEDILEEIV